MATVTNAITLPDGSIPTHCAVEIELVASTSGAAAGWVNASDVTIMSKVRPTVTDGEWSADLTPNADIDPAGTAYRVTEYADKTRVVNYVEVGSGGGTVHDLLTTAPTVGGLLFQSVSGHNAASDAHSGFYRSGGTDVAVADGGTGASSAGAARTSLVAQRSFVLHSSDYASLQDLFDAAEAAGVTAHIAGSHTISAQLSIMCDVTSDPGAVITVSGITDEAAVVIAADGLLRGAEIHLPKIARASRPWSAGVSTTDAGVRVERAYNCSVSVRTIENFSIGFDASPSAVGCACNRFEFGYLHNNGIQVRLYPRSNGWVNENRWNIRNASIDSNIGTAVSGVRQIKFVSSDSTNAINNNVFTGNIEGAVAEYHLEATGWYNRFESVRWECTGGARVWWRSDARYNAIVGGFDVESIVQTSESGAYYNQVWGHLADVVLDQESYGTLRMQSGSSSSNKLISLYNTTSSPVHTKSTDWVIAAGATELAFKQSGDTTNRLSIAPSSGTMSWGPGGSTAADTTLSRSAAGVLAVNGALKVASYATGSRPSAATAGAGAMVYDSTLGIPIWSNGSVWKDAAGTTV